MSLDAEEFIRLQKQVEKARQEAARLEGVEGQILERLKKEFNVKGFPEAKRLLEKLEEQEERIEREYEKAKTEFENNWKGSLDEL